jgi:hypothetical protein
MKNLIIAAAIIMAPQASYAAVSNPVLTTEDISSAVDQRCQSELCEQVVREIMMGKMGRAAAVRGNGVASCVKANSTLGGLISQASFNVRQGRSHEEGSDIANLIYTDTYFVRLTLRDIIAIGDAKQCDKLMRVGNYIIGEITKKYN